MLKKTLTAMSCLLALAASVIGYNAVAETTTTDKPAKSAMKKTITELEKIDHKIGEGKEALPVVTVVVHYTGWLYDPSKPEGKGAKFDSSVDRGEPFSFALGTGSVIRGWDEGVAGMKVGGKRTLIIPTHMGYGSRGAGSVIPPYANLIFDVELLDVK
jgi:FKBP-type peptidyl-prolyl cis-trans isomerase FkpA